MSGLANKARFLSAFLFIAFAQLLFSADAFATHFRYGTMSWAAANGDPANKITFKFQSSWRRSFFATANLPTPNLGDTMDVGKLAPFVFGDGTQLTTYNGTVTSANINEDWVIVESTITHLYPTTTKSYLAYFTNCCRLSSLTQGNNDVQFTVNTNVTINMLQPNRSPVAASLPIITLPVNVTSTFSIAATDPDGDALTFSFSPSGSAPNQSGLFLNPPAGMTMTSAGVVKWKPTAVGLYALQVRATDARGAYTVIDVILNVKSLPSTGSAPTVTVNGSNAPAKIFVKPGTPISFAITATDTDIDAGTGLANSFVSVFGSGLPAGSFTTPSLPHTGRSPATSTFSWTPQVADGGTRVLAFNATDGAGLSQIQATTITIEVAQNHAPILSCPTASIIEATSATGANAVLEAIVNDTDAGDSVDLTWKEGSTTLLSETVAGGAPITSNYSGALALGVHTINVTANDGTAAAVTCSTTVTVADTIAPVLAIPADIELEADSATGSIANYVVTATDTVDPAPVVSCTPASGSLFAIGSNAVSCTATDAAGNASTSSFNVIVADKTAPTLSLPADITLEATSIHGAIATFATTATDSVDPAPQVNCTPASGSTFPLGKTSVTCTATDQAGNSASGSFNVDVLDTTAPALTAPADLTVGATGLLTLVDIGMATASDAVGVVSLTNNAPATFPLGVTTVVWTAKDAGGNTSTATQIITVADTTKPTISAAATTAPNAAGWYKDSVTVQFICNDTLSGIASCPADQILSAEGPAVSSTAQTAADLAGNISEPSNVITVGIDKTAPTVNWNGGISENSLFNWGSVPAAPTCNAIDGLSGAKSCVVSGYSNTVGKHTLTAVATDNADNVTTVTLSYEVKGWTLSGFYQPVDMNGVWNTVKNGATVPLKFEIFAATEITDVSAISFTVKGVTCPGSSAITDDIELTTTGGTALRYDTVAGQFIQNWQTPKLANACYVVTMKAADGSTIAANFKLK